jgi:16S rRNA (cytidine1402-2'-O)-methyltransferase
MSVPQPPGCVYVVATPIGNLDDLSPRARRALAEVALIACEDTRHTGLLCRRFGVHTPRVSLHAHNEARRIPELLERLRAGESIALVSDAGTPLISDPGERLVRAALGAGFAVVPVPGPSAALAALVASGLPTRPFAFLGFLARRGRERAAQLELCASFPGSLVLFEAGNRVAATLADLRERLGPRRVAVCRELTKRHEEVLRGRLGELEPGQLRGEVTLVVEGGAGEALLEPEADDEIAARLDALLAAGHSPRDAARAAARELGVSRSRAYALLLERRRERPGAR